MDSPHGFIDLSRSFGELRDDPNNEDIALNSYGSPDWLFRSMGKTWAELLEIPLLVILGEPGSGKTFEMRHQAALKEPDCERFFLRLDEIAHENQLPLSQDEASRFNEWRSSKKRGIFFLDSVDEAKIHKSADFHIALRNFRSALGDPNLGRSTIVISSRITDWVPATDFAEVRSCFGVGSLQEGKDSNLPRIFQILPMDRKAVEKYVSARGVASPTAFLEAIDAAHAWEFTRRPADVDDLQAFWSEKGSLGTLTEILNFTIEKQLRKASDRDRTELLALDKARQGAECLAAATVLCRKYTFQIPGDMPQSEALDALACLPDDWRPEEARTLLNRPIFDGASHGRIRFHHRRISEFLAARWLNNLMRLDCPFSQLELILTEFQSNHHVMRPATAPVAAWLASGNERWNRSVFRWILEATPELFLQYGDAASLQVSDRSEIIDALIAQAQGRQHLWWTKDRAALARLAHPDLSSKLTELLRKPELGDDIKEIILGVIETGSLSDCADAALEVAISDLTRGQIFFAAAMALKQIGSKTHFQKLSDAALLLQSIPARVIGPLVQLLYPKYWTPQQLIGILQKIRDDPGYGRDYFLTSHFEETTDEGDGLELLDGLLTLALDEEAEMAKPVAPEAAIQPEEGGMFNINTEPPRYLSLALAVARGVCKKTAMTESEAELIGRIFALADDTTRGIAHHALSEESFQSLTENLPWVRKHFVHEANRRLKIRHTEREPSLYEIQGFFSSWKPLEIDFEWLLPDFRAESTSSGISQFSNWLLQLWRETGKNRLRRIQLENEMRRSPKARAIAKAFFRPPLKGRILIFWYSHLDVRIRRLRRKFSRRELGRFWQRQKDRWWLFRNKKGLAAGEKIGALVNLLGEGHKSGNNKWGSDDLSALAKRRGATIAQVTREGCKVFWRRYRPTFPHSRPEGGGPTHGTIIGLAGISFALQDGELDFGSVSSDEAQQMTLYAINEMSGFAPWIFELAKAHPEAVKNILCTAIVAEWEWDGPLYPGLVIYNLSWSEKDLAPLVTDHVLTCLERSEPKNYVILESAISVVLNSTQAASRKFLWIIKKYARRSPLQSPSFVAWNILLIQIDSILAIETLDREVTRDRRGKNAVIAICAAFAGRSVKRLLLNTYPAFVQPDAMKLFVPFVYRHVRREEDISRPSGGFVTPRDDATRFRDTLILGFAQSGGPNVDEVLQSFLRVPRLWHMRDYIHHLRQSHEQKLAIAEPWKAPDIRTFSKEHERDPISDEDLYYLIWQRLADLKAWVETGEDSPREEVHPEDKENGFRRWLARRLRDKSRGRYIVPEEWELDAKLRPDLRIAIPSASPVSLELKIADEWSLPDLLNGLEGQLVGKYLRDHRARFGFYVLVQFNRSRRWDSPDGTQRLDSDRILQILVDKAATIVNQRPDISGISVLWIHFSR
jgi:hypothetical protein